MKEDPDYFCDACHRGFSYENTLCEHFYHEHMDIILWHCKKCNEGFHYKSNRLKHRQACPNKNGPDQYPRHAPYDEALEETFKPKTAIAVKIPAEVQVEDQPQEGENVGQPQPEPQVSDQVQLQVGETERAVASLGETGSDILNRLVEGEMFGGVIDDDEDDQLKDVKKEEMEIEMTFDD